MSTKRLILGSIPVAFVVGIFLLAILVVPVRAQCGEPPYPSCVNCHAEKAQPDAPDQWHNSHYMRASCINCHGGNGAAADQAPAHVGMLADPLDDIYTGCYQCHPENYQTVASGYAATLNVTPSSCATPTPVPAGSLTSSFHGGGLSLSSNSGSSVIRWQTIAGVLGSLAFLAVFLVGVGWLERHRLSH